MPRTTVNLDGPILAELRARAQRERKPLGRLASELLAGALAPASPARRTRRRPQWIAKDLGRGLDYADTDALYEAMERG